MYEDYNEQFDNYIKINNQNVSSIMLYMGFLFFMFAIFLSNHTVILTNEIIELNKQLKISQTLTNLTDLEESDTSESETSETSEASEAEAEAVYKCDNNSFTYSNHSN